MWVGDEGRVGRWVICDAVNYISCPAPLTLTHAPSAQSNGLVSDEVVNQKQLFRFINGRLEWTRQWPHERIKRRIAEAGFGEEQVRAALEGRG